MKKHLAFFRYLAYSVEIILLIVLQSTPKLMPELFGGKPLLLVPLAIVIASKENQIPSLIFGAVCGILTDAASGGFVGFFAITLTVLCYIESYMFSSYFNAGILTVSITAAITFPILICLYFLIFCVIAGIPDCMALFVHHYISRIIYTFVMTFPLYFINLFVHKHSVNVPRL